MPNAPCIYPLACIDAAQLLDKVAHFEEVSVFYNGKLNRSKHAKHTAVIAYRASQQQQPTWHSLKDIMSRPNAGNYVGNYQQSEHFVAGWVLALPYSAGADRYLHQQTDCIYAHYHHFSIYLDLSENHTFIQSYQELQNTDIEKIRTELQAIIARPQSSPIRPNWQPMWSEAEYQYAFEQVQRYLAAGDAYQINLTFPYTCQQDLTKQSPVALFKHFQAPFCAYFKVQEAHQVRVLFCVSPERLVQVKHGQIKASPIKGTMPRGTTPAEDNALKKQLQTCPKNRAENLMIVDLLRNDLSHSAKLNSIKVAPIFKLESYKNVHHLVSHVHGTLSSAKQLGQLIEDVFPGGSITGAPKKRAIEIINELEARSRGFYCGSLGYVDVAGHCDFNILIRSIEANPKAAYCWGGGGVVVDSKWHTEYQEIQHKIRSLLDFTF